MQVFYAPDISGSSYMLGQSESKHIIKVLRLKRGDSVKLIDGKGNLFDGVIGEPDQRRCVIEIQSVTPDFEKRNYRLHIAISPLKNTDRFEWFIEKAVEIGIDEITPLLCRYTEKPGIKTERLKNIIISAMKQSLKAKEPVLNPVKRFAEFISEDYISKLMIAHCHSDIERKSISEVYFRGEDAIIMIGPEGDFSMEEINATRNRHLLHIHFGTSRLRTETAGIAACHSVYLINQQ